MKVADVIARIPDLANLPADNIEVRRLGGITNNNYRLIAVGLDCILRVPRQLTNQWINRENERHNLDIAVSSGLAPRYRYFDQTGIMLSDNLPHCSELSVQLLQKENRLTQLAKQLRRVHDCRPAFKGQVDLSALIKRYFYLMPPDQQQALADAYEEIKSLLPNPADTAQTRLVSSHNDLVLQNLLVQEDRLWFIDWEYSSLASPYWDLATICNELDLDKTAATEFLGVYCGGESGFDARQLDIYRTLLGFLSDCWLRAFHPPC